MLNIGEVNIIVRIAKLNRVAYGGVIQQFQEIVCFAEFFRFLLALSCLLMYT